MDKPTAILVVSSESKYRRALADILNGEGWGTVCASTVGECQEILSSHNVGLVLCDRRLTDGTYRDILFLARLLGRSVRLVVTSRLADWSEYLEALQDGAFDLLAFPGETAEIIRVISQALREYQKTAMPFAVGKAQTVTAGARFDQHHVTLGTRESRDILQLEPGATQSSHSAAED